MGAFDDILRPEKSTGTPAPESKPPATSGSFTDIVKPGTAAAAAVTPPAPKPAPKIDHNEEKPWWWWGPKSGPREFMGLSAVDPNAPDTHPLSDVLPQAYKHVKGDAVETITNILKGAKDIGQYAWNNPGTVAANLPAYPVKMGEELAKHYGETYGSWDKAKAFAGEHPVQFAVDMIPAIGPVARVLKEMGRGVKGISDVTGATNVVSKAADVTGATKAAEKIGEVAGKIGDVGSTVINAPGNIIGGVSNYFTKAGEGAAQEAYRTGKLGHQIGEEFRTALRDPAVGMDTALTNAKQGVQTMKEAMFSRYAGLEPIWKSDTTRLNFNKINAAEQDVLNEIRAGSNSSSFKISDKDRARIQNLQDVIEQWRRDPSLHNIEGFDSLKQRLRNEVNWGTDSTPVKRAATNLSNSAKEAIFDQIPDTAPYKQAMKDYFESSGHIGDIQDALALGDKAKAQTSMSRLQSVMRNNAYTLYGARKGALERLEREGNVSIKPSIAGAAMSSPMPRGIAGAFGAGIPGLGGLMLGTHGLTLEAIMAALGGAALTSPRLAGELFHGAGRLRGAPSPRDYLPTGTLTNVLNREGADQKQPQKARGGRIDMIHRALNSTR